MITPELMFGLGVVGIAIGFGLCRRARDAESGNDAWDQAGSLLQIIGGLVILLGCALMIQPPPNAIASPVVVRQPLSSQKSGLHLRLPRPSAMVDPGGETDDLPDWQKR
jgi:hypothetical protein